MPQDRVLEKVTAPENAPGPPPRSADEGRIVSVDLLRGLVVALMALDHTRDFFGTGGFNPRDVTEPALFLTRWITHFCAQTFVLLAGFSAFLYGRVRGIAQKWRIMLSLWRWYVVT